MALQFLRRCSESWGSCRVIGGDPEVGHHCGVTYLPFGQGRNWGIYDALGALVMDTVDLHGPEGGRHPDQAESLDRALLGGVEEASEATYIYGGFINPHYGHFIVNSLARQWPRVRSPQPKMKVLCHGPADPDHWFGRPFIKAIFNALGLTRADLVTFDRPTMIPRLIVPLTSMREQHYVHSVFGDLCARIGRNLLGAEHAVRDARPAYLSKAGLTSGVGRVVNEVRIVEILERAGVDIVFPEQIDLPSQIRLFAERERICGIAGSALHTQAFWPAPGRVSMISPTPGPNSNFFLIDLASKLHVDYFYPPGSRVVEEGSAAFITSIEMQNPELVAADILRLLSS
ncbi:MAG: glycosyltransferase family 61 protein [Proteobacteria bacterium]|nr:glycosyltransferase family 61 protein [Pseudomonadota bacterium]